MIHLIRFSSYSYHVVVLASELQKQWFALSMMDFDGLWPNTLLLFFLINIIKYNKMLVKKLLYFLIKEPKQNIKLS